MISPYKKIIVYDLETGGFYSKYNSITEIAMVAIDLESLEIVDEFSVMLSPYINVESRESDINKESKQLYKLLNKKDDTLGANVLKYKGDSLTLNNLESVSKDVKMLYKYLDSVSVLTNDDILNLQNTSSLKDIVDLYFDKAYSPQALEVTHISRKMLQEQGVGFMDAFSLVSNFIKKHTIGNSKPILAGHNIKGFDNEFLHKMFKENGQDLDKVINQTQMIDTLEWARLRWFEMPSYSLGVCANEVGLTLKEAHRALPDTVANAKFLIKMLQSLRGEGQQSSKYKRRKFNFNNF